MTHEIKGLLIQGTIKPMFGVKLQLENDMVFVRNITKGSLADQAGVQSGDIIKSINGELIEYTKQAVTILSKLQLGETANLVIEREGKTQKIPVKCE